MSFTSKAIIDFTDYKEDQIGPVALTIGSSLTTNAADFAGLPVSGATVTSQANAYIIILAKPIYSTKTADLAASRTILETSLRSNGLFVNTVANGDEVLLAKSGYPVTHPPVHHGALAKGTLTANSTDNNGEFSFEIDGVLHAKGYMLCYTLSTNPETDPLKWSWQWCPKNKGLLSGLDKSAKYKLMATGVGVDPSLSFSDKIERTTQG